ncbi:MAG: AraC family transcriptional regulator [Ferruginibacter sp.]
MNPHLLKIPLLPDHSFNVRYDIVPQFYDKWHYHQELELVHIIKGTGKQFIGDDIHHFKPDDLILLGANLPHLWHSDKKYLHKGAAEKVEAIVIHFMPDCFGSSFFSLPENAEIAKLFLKAQQGIRITDATRKTVSDLMTQLLTAANSDRIILLLRVLQTIARSRHTKTACSKGLQYTFSPSETDRLNTIYQYILDNFSKEITLEEIAKVANISPHSFCRYFKSRIKKTFSKFLLEIRIGHACKLLTETNKTVATICYDSGFNNFSNFNRHFKSITRKTPLEYRKHFELDAQ